jgi:hypothetical protein
MAVRIRCADLATTSLTAKVGTNFDERSDHTVRLWTKKPRSLFVSVLKSRLVGCYAVWLTDVSQECTASIIRVTEVVSS